MKVVPKSTTERASYLKRKGFLIDEAKEIMKSKLFDIVYKILETNNLDEAEYKRLKNNSTAWYAVVSVNPDLWNFRPGNITWY